MIEILGVKLSYEAVVAILAFVASEIIGESKLKENSIAGLVKSLIDTLKPSRKEDEKVEEVKKAALLLTQTLRELGDK